MLKWCATAALWAANAAPVGRFTRAMLIWPPFCVRPSTGGAGSLAARPELLSGVGCVQLCCYAFAAKAMCGRSSLHWRLKAREASMLGSLAQALWAQNSLAILVPMLTCECVRRRCVARHDGGERACGGQHTGQPGCGAAGAADWAALRSDAAAVHGGVRGMQPRSGSGAASAVRAGDLHRHRLAEDLRPLLPGAHCVHVSSLLAHAFKVATDGGLDCCHPW